MVHIFNQKRGCAFSAYPFLFFRCTESRSCFFIFVFYKKKCIDISFTVSILLFNISNEIKNIPIFLAISSIMSVLLIPVLLLIYQHTMDAVTSQENDRANEYFKTIIS